MKFIDDNTTEVEVEVEVEDEFDNEEVSEQSSSYGETIETSETIMTEETEKDEDYKLNSEYLMMMRDERVHYIPEETEETIEEGQCIFCGAIGKINKKCEECEDEKIIYSSKIKIEDENENGKEKFIPSANKKFLLLKKKKKTPLTLTTLVKLTKCYVNTNNKMKKNGMRNSK